MYKYTQVKDEALYPAVLEIYRSNPAYFALNDAPMSLAAIDEDVHAKPPAVPDVNKRYILITDAADEPVAVLDYLLDYPEEGIVYLGLLIVHKARQGQHVGRAIMAELCDYFRTQGKQAIRLGVLANNEAALTFWQKIGFKITTENKRSSQGDIVHEMEIQLID
jgi:ribosomal protein S18 acetylase RimI-like enzyme